MPFTGSISFDVREITFGPNNPFGPQMIFMPGQLSSSVGMYDFFNVSWGYRIVSDYSEKTVTSSLFDDAPVPIQSSVSGLMIS